MTELLVICVDCSTEFVEAEGWLERCAECCAVYDDHLSGLHDHVIEGCARCERRTHARSDRHAA
ncbi:hypothetical protein CLV56_1930 [Mumia flava]|uniref:Uncharacterized protein n=1 Tax=Mumia flava TaxID=1348852 RepID=A0A0B2B1Z2_9ACTN|nr:hypothetical protein [Mumia flava]PJJ57692.1 hypothetical protein CLV56_1930 [Mumia flava]